MLTVREMALLQGFPHDYVFKGPLPARYNQIGDAVPPLIAIQIAQLVADLKYENVPFEVLAAEAPADVRELVSGLLAEARRTSA